MKRFVVFVVVFIAGYGGYLLWKNSPATSVPSASQTPTPSPTPASSPTDSYTLTQVAQHGDKDSCWLAIDGKVYDVSEFVASGFHPGKAAILAGCGKDATELFNTRPMGTGTSHSERARKMLPKYYIGELTPN